MKNFILGFVMWEIIDYINVDEFVMIFFFLIKVNYNFFKDISYEIEDC